QFPGDSCCPSTSRTCDGVIDDSGHCVVCGQLGQACCPGQSCVGSGVTCSAGWFQAGTCKRCGGLNELCCADFVCHAGLRCSIDGACISVMTPDANADAEQDAEALDALPD